MLFLFLVGVKMDASLIKKSGRRAMVIGICAFLMPLILNLLLALILTHFVPMNPSLHGSLLWVASFQSLSSFQVIVCVLADLKLLNSELGRLAISSSMISGTCSFVWAMIVFATRQSVTGKKQVVMVLMSVFSSCLLIFVAYILRPVMLWIVRQTTHEKAVKESHVFAIFLMILGCATFSEMIGQHFLFGPMILGMIVPDGPPLGSALITKLDSFVSYIILPIYFVISGARIDFSSIHLRNAGIVELLALSAFLCKVMGTMLPSLYCKMPVTDAFCLGAIMSTQGIMDVLILGRAAQLQLIDKESYSVMVLSTVFLTGAISPIVKILYKPSKRYIPYKKRTIQHAKPNNELRMLACIYHQDQTRSIINLLEASNPNLLSPIFVYVVHLVELSGRAAPLIVAHHPGIKNTSEPSQSDRIINAFRVYEKQNPGVVVVYPFTAISPYATMHDDVCSLAVDKRVSIVIVPFHKLWTMHGPEVSVDATRAVNRYILKNAPCSVGILLDRSTMNGNTSPLTLTRSKTLFSIGMIFLGGQDDWEALAYAIRMAQHTNVRLTVVRFLESGKQQRYSGEMEQDSEMINQFRVSTMKNDNCDYHEEVVKDSVGVVSVIQKMQNSFELILVGRRHTNDSPLLEGEWNEFPELGFIGDMLASSDSNCKVPVLVVQQQSFVGEELLESPKFVNEDSCALVHMRPWETHVKVWPVS